MKLLSVMRDTPQNSVGLVHIISSSGGIRFRDITQPAQPSTA